MTERERMALLEACSKEFRAEHCFEGPMIHEPKRDGIPRKAEPRHWLFVKLNHFRLVRPQDSLDSKWVSWVYGQRSDGELFQVTIAFPEKFEPLKGDRMAFVSTTLANAWHSFDRFKNCSCAIIGSELTDELDSEGERRTRLIFSPCEIHHPTAVEQPA